jgi:hypothetical protein
MPRRYGNRNRAYRPKNRRSFSRAYKTGAPQGGAGRRSRERDIGPMPVLKLVLGRARVWLFNNSNRSITLGPGQGLILQIVEEFSHRLGDAFRLTVIGPAGSEGQDNIEFKKSDWA